MLTVCVVCDSMVVVYRARPFLYYGISIYQEEEAVWWYMGTGIGHVALEHWPNYLFICNSESIEFLC